MPALSACQLSCRSDKLLALQGRGLLWGGGGGGEVGKGAIGWLSKAGDNGRCFAKFLHVAMVPSLPDHTEGCGQHLRSSSGHNSGTCSVGQFVAGPLHQKTLNNLCIPLLQQEAWNSTRGTAGRCQQQLHCLELDCLLCARAPCRPAGYG